jgi:RHS repeat-associated protein
MAMSVVYATINGQIVSENRGGVISYYAPDNLGSTVALLDTTGTVTDTFTYWPYGEIQSHVGSSVTPLTFCGTHGYYLDILGSQIYIRARYLRQALTRWQTLDPIWPRYPGYSYVAGSPTYYVDPLGLEEYYPYGFNPPPLDGPGPSPVPVITELPPNPVLSVGTGIIGGLLACIGEAAVNGLYSGGDSSQYMDWCLSCCRGIFTGAGAGIGVAVSAPSGPGAILGFLGGGAVGFGAGYLACPGICDPLINGGGPNGLPPYQPPTVGCRPTPVSTLA